ncbi:MAG: hypothetical protein ABI442_19135 [Gemmatimonadaceae bacterium]
MTAVTVTNEQLLAAAIGLIGAKSTNALASVKLAKLRRAVEAETSLLRSAIDETAQLHAIREDGKPLVLKNDAGNELVLLSSRTPAYAMEPEAAAAFRAELAPLLAEPVTLTIAPLTETDLASIELRDDHGASLLPFSVLA